MFNTFRGRVFAIGVAITSSAATLAAVKAKNISKEESISPELNSDSIDGKLQSINSNKDLSGSESPINSCITRLSQWRQINGIPGLVVGVSLKGQNVWIYSEGFSDIENGLKCNDKTVMRIASISKSMTALLLAKLIQENRIDLDKPITQYLTKDQFPDKYWGDNKVDITLRQLASHLGGIRHYKKDPNQPNNKQNDNKKDNKKDGPLPQGYQLGEFSLPEYYLKETYDSVMQSLNLFKDDPLVSKPGTKYNYTTFGYTLISAIIESQLNGEKFEKYLIKFLREDLGLENTYLDQNDPIIYNRSHFYVKSPPNGRLLNAPYVDNSYKWAGGGLLSNVYDLLKFGNIMLYSFKGGSNGKPGFIKKEIIDQMWTPAQNTKIKGKFGGYGIGWRVIRDENAKYAFCSEPAFSDIISHSGAAVGGSSILMIEPNNELIVTIIVNLENISMVPMATEIAQILTKYLQNNNFKSPNTKLDWDNRWGGYGLGWGVIRGIESKYAFCSEPPFPTILSHTGGAIGASSVILIEPNSELIVTIITNTQNVSGIYTMALDIAKQFTQKDISSNQLLSQFIKD